MPDVVLRLCLVVAGEAASGRNRQLAPVDAAVARDSMQAIPGIGEAMLGPPPGTGDPFTRASGVPPTTDA